MRRAALLFSLFAGACASGAGNAPISYGGGPTPAPPPYAPPRVEYARGAPSAQPIQARAPRAPVSEDTALSAYALQPETNDPRRPPQTHTVGVNESLYDIAAHYQIPLRALIEQNHLDPLASLAPGRVIELPPPRIHVVAQGESFDNIASANNIDRRSLALLNRMSPPYDVRPGDQIVLPAQAAAWTSAPPPLPEPIIAPPPAAPPPTAPPVAPPVAVGQTGGRFAWPVRGEVVARYGAQPGGRRLDGIEIAAVEGSRIGAAEEGDVVYAGSDLPGYGGLVLLRHADGFVTAYGYARRILVREGQHVRAGETLAEVGRSGEGRAMMLFQVRQGARAVDPAPLLGLRQ